MKIALVVPGGVDRSGEIRVIPALLWLIERLASRHELHVFALSQERNPGEWNLLGARIHNTGDLRTYRRTLQAIAAEQRRSRFEVMHGFFAGWPGLIAVTAARLLGVPSLVHIAGGELQRIGDIRYGGRLTWRSRVMTAACLRGARLITTPSEPMVAAARSFGYRARCLPLGVDLRTWAPRPPRPREMHRAARLLHVASLNRVKDQTMLLRALALLARGNIDFHIDIVGEDTLSGSIQSLARELGLEERVRFHGFVPQQKLRPMMEGADVLVMASRHEAGPIVLREAAAVGVPTVGTAVGHIAEWAPQAAVATPVSNAALLAAGLRELLDDEPRRLSVATAAFERSIREDADFTARRFNEIYDELAVSEKGNFRTI